MDNTGLIVTFLLENNKKRLYRRIYETLPFQTEILDNEDISFFYHLKDSGNQVEEILIPKIKKSGSDGEELREVYFKVFYGDKELVSYEIESKGLTDKEIKNSEVEIYYFFEDLIKKFESKMMDEHKKIVLYKER